VEVATAGDLEVEVSDAAALEEEALLVASHAVALPAVVLLAALPPLGSLVATLRAEGLLLVLRAAGLLAVALLAEALSAAFTVGTSVGAFSAGLHSALAWASDTARTVIMMTTRATRGHRTATRGFAVTTTEAKQRSGP
jgi:hypothetical protein